MIQHPRQLANLVDTGAGIDHNHRPVEEIGSGSRKGDGDAPHADCKAVHIKQRITARTENSVDRHIIHCAPDHIECRYKEHSLQIRDGFRSQLHEVQNNRNRHTHQRQHDKS